MTFLSNEESEQQLASKVAEELLEQQRQEVEGFLTILRQGVEAWNRWRKEEPGISPNLSLARLSKADLREADFHDAILIGIDLREADLRGVNLHHAALRGAELRGADLRGANLDDAMLTHADLREANLTGANLTRAWLCEITLEATILGNLDLRHSLELETIQHDGPSTIGLDTISRSHGKIPTVFLRGAGVPESLIALLECWRGD